MLYSHYNFNEEFSKNNGNKNKRTALALTELSKLIVDDREAVISVLNRSGINIEESATPHQIKRAIIQNVNPRSKRSKLILHRLSKLILAKNDRSLSSAFSNLVEDDKGLEKKTDEKEKGLEKKTAEKEKSGWFKNNASALGSLAGGLLGGIISTKGKQQIDEQVNTMSNPKPNDDEKPDADKKTNTGKIILFGVIGLSIIGLSVLLIRKMKK